MSKADEKRKIIEVYITENEEEGNVSFEFLKTEDSEVANDTMKLLINMLTFYKGDEDDAYEGDKTWVKYTKGMS